MKEDTTIYIHYIQESVLLYKISGKVVDTNGEAVRGAKVYTTGPGSSLNIMHSTTTDENGEYSLYVDDIGKFYVNASGFAGKYADFVSTTEYVNVVEQTTEYTQNLTIDTCSYIAGAFNFTGASAATDLTFTVNGHEYKLDQYTNNNYILRVPPNTQGTLTAKGGDYQDRTYEYFLTAEAGGQITQDINFYKTGYKLTCNFGAHDDSYDLIYYSLSEGISLFYNIPAETTEYDLTLPPNSEGTLLVNKFVPDKTFRCNVVAGNEGDTGTLDVKFESSPKLTVTINNGSFDPTTLVDQD